MGSTPCGQKLVLLFFLHVLLVPNSGSAYPASTRFNPFSPRASLVRHWNRLFSSVDIPSVLLSKSSPLNATQLATFARYMDTGTIPQHLPSFCRAANLFCDLRLAANTTQDGATNAEFDNYSNRQFKRYRKGGAFDRDSFKNYSVGKNVAHDSFSGYGQDATGRSEHFANYASRTNVAGTAFTSYTARANGASADFRTYGSGSNIQRQDFKAYGRDGSGDTQRFSSYSESSNIANNGFSSYGSEANSAISDFAAYANRSNVATNRFTSYGDRGNGASGAFSGYAGTTNVGKNEFAAYNGGGNGGMEEFTTYGDDRAGLPENVFRTYGRRTNDPYERFTSYGNSTSPSRNEFAEYNRDAAGSSNAMFVTYFGEENVTSFKEYFRSATTFEDYRNSSITIAGSTAGISSPRPAVEAGKFFRRDTLVAGNKIPFPDIRDKLPPRSFLPRPLAKKFPFSSSKLPELVEVFGGNMQAVMERTISECERPAAKDETKRCVTSIEDMAEFAASTLGMTAAASTTASTAGSGETVVVGKAVARNGGKETRSVSCHQSMFPFMVYYCHMVPRVMVYDVEIVGPVDDADGSVGTLNLAVAICHMDTSQWGPTHAAFVALGSGPGKIEVCHFIFENDLLWVAH